MQGQVRRIKETWNAPKEFSCPLPPGKTSTARDVSMDTSYGEISLDGAPTGNVLKDLKRNKSKQIVLTIL